MKTINNQKKKQFEFKVIGNDEILQLIWKNRIGKSFIIISGALVAVYLTGKALRLLGTASNDYLHFRESIFKHKKMNYGKTV